MFSLLVPMPPGPLRSEVLECTAGRKGLFSSLDTPLNNILLDPESPMFLGDWLALALLNAVASLDSSFREALLGLMAGWPPLPLFTLSTFAVKLLPEVRVLISIRIFVIGYA